METIDIAIDCGDIRWETKTEKQLLQWVEKNFSKVPDKYREDARIEFDSSSDDYGGSYLDITITYKRPKTAEEIAHSEEVKANRQALADIKERAEYERLKEKYA